MSSEKVSAKTFARKLRTRLAELKRSRATRKAIFSRRLVRWRQDMKNWLLVQGAKRIDRIEPQAFVRSRYGAAHHLNGFFEGAPNAPAAPSYDQEKAIQNKLRHLAITGASSLYVNEEDTRRYFSDDPDSDSEGDT